MAAVVLLLVLGGVAAWRVLFWQTSGDDSMPRRQHPEGPVAATFTNRFGMEFVRVPRGKFWMGGRAGVPGDSEVEVPYDFYLGRYEVTQGQWQAVLGENPSYFSRSGAGQDSVRAIADEELQQFPVELVSWDDTQRFLQALNRADREAGWVYCLPTEVEWEYACRGGPMTERADSAFDYYFAEPTNQLPEGMSNYYRDAGLKRTCAVGSYPPNRLGLYDMHGNVYEWCADLATPPRQSRHVVRGGCWGFGPNRLRAATRDTVPAHHAHNSLGLRVARVHVAGGGN
jgi:formylglycine-generating enzyme required for sulfatase activity